MRILTLLPAFISAAVGALYEDSSPVISFSFEHFKTEIQAGKEPWLVKLYSDNCAHCAGLVPEFEKTAKALQGLIKVGASNDPALLKVLDPDGIPEIRLFLPTSTSDGVEYEGSRKAYDLVDFVLNEMRRVASKRLPEKKPAEERKNTKKPKTAPVVELFDSSFDDKLADPQVVWFVEFFAPWCGHCQALAPVWDQVAARLDGRVKVAKVDATTNNGLAQRFNIRGFPTLLLFPMGTRGRSPSYQTFQGERTADAMVDFALKFYSEIKEVKQITSERQFDEDCGTSTCMIAFLPHLLDNYVKPRSALLGVLKEAMLAAGDNPLKFFWSQGGDQFEVEEKLRLQFGWPAIVAVNREKQKFAVHRGTVDKDAISQFIQQLIVGRAALDPLPNFEFKKAKKWDGKDSPAKSEL